MLRAAQVHYIERPELMRTARRMLFEQEGAAIASPTHAAAVGGMGGLGKSVMMNALLHDSRVRSHFLDGVAPIEFGRDETAESAAKALVKTLGGAWDEDLSLEENLRAVFRSKPRLLLALDDVWTASQARAFRDVARELGLGLLVSSRDEGLCRRLLGGACF